MNKLHKYRCHKTVHAEPMTFGDFQMHKGRLPAQDDQAKQDGYLVIYNKDTPDHYESWSPKKQFEEGYFKLSEQDKASPMMRYFAYGHLPERLQEISKPLGEIALLMDAALPEGAEKSAGLRKLLEAKDCFVRAYLD